MRGLGDEGSPTAFVLGDIFETAERWRTASVVLANVLLFPKPVVARLAALLGAELRPGAFVLSTAPLDDDALLLRHAGLHVKSSWTGGAKVDVYQKGA